MSVAAPWEGGLIASGDRPDTVLRDLEAGSFA
jgi:hypothetical protein